MLTNVLDTFFETVFIIHTYARIKNNYVFLIHIYVFLTRIFLHIFPYYEISVAMSCKVKKHKEKKENRTLVGFSKVPTKTQVNTNCSPKSQHISYSDY
jgi:hypothetical protein